MSQVFGMHTASEYHSDAELGLILVNSELLILDANKSALIEFFQKSRKEVKNKPLLTLLAEKKIEIQDLAEAIKYCEDLTPHEIRLHHPEVHKDYDVILTCFSIKNETCYLLTIKEIHSGSYKSLKAYMNAIINNLPGSVYWKDREGRYLGCNRHVAHMAGFETVEEVIGKTDYDLCWQEFAADWQALDQEVMRTGKTISREEKAKLANGNIITELTFKTPLRDEYNTIVGIIGTSLDITDKKILEEQLTEAKEKAENANKAKTEFLYNIRHDIRTPFNGLLSLSLLLEKEEQNVQKKEFLHDIAQSAQELLNYLNEIVEFMKVEDSAAPVLFKPLDIRNLFDEITKTMLPAAQYHFLKIVAKVSSDVPQTVLGDHYRVHRVLLNLVGNAIKFTKEGSITIGADTVKQEDNKIILKIWVQDTGMGIPEDKYNVIFERFNRLTSSYSGTYKGTGLGLWAVKRLIDELGGQIFVESQINAGSTFTCIIPFERLLTD